MTDKEDSFKFQFIYENESTGEVVNMSRVFDDNWTAWPDVLQQFLSFLSACYGYSIFDQVEVNPRFKPLTEDSE
jgi:hypothetical protein